MLKHISGYYVQFYRNILFVGSRNVPSLSISNTLMASCGVRFLNSLAGSVCRLCRRGLTTLTGVFRKKGLRNGEPLTCMMPQITQDGRFWLFVRTLLLSSFAIETLDWCYKQCSQSKSNPASKTFCPPCLSYSSDCNVTHFSRQDADLCVSVLSLLHLFFLSDLIP